MRRDCEDSYQVVLRSLAKSGRINGGADVRCGRACHGPADHRRAGFAQRDHDHRRQATAAARPEIRRRDQGEGLGVEAVVAAARRAAQGRAQRAADHDRRLRLRRAEHVRRRRPDAGTGSHREKRAALHASSIPRRSARRRGRR